MKLFSKHVLLLIGILWVIAGAPEVFAFSIGEIQVQSKFGEKFNASFEINLDFDGPVEVGLGDVIDYNKLGLDRQDIIDALVADPVPPGGGLRKTVQIRSNSPLFFPSFNLVVWATHNGGTLLENFLVTVDFQQSLALNVRGNKKKSPKLPNNEPRQEPLVGQEKTSQPAEIQQFAKEGLEKGSPKELAVVAGPESPSRTPEPKTPNEEPKVAPEEAEVLSPEAIVPVPAKVQVMHRRRLSGVIWAYPRSFPDLTTVSPVQADVVRTETAPSATPNTGTSTLVEKTGPEIVQSLPLSNEGYVMKKGEGLFSIARKLKIGNYHPAQIVIAIWMHNIDKFIFGNINGIQEGVQLDLENLEDHVSAIDLATARSILKGQTLEWDLAKSATPVKAEVQEKNIPEIPLPSERLADHADLFEQVIGWQTTWKNMDIEGHLAYYQDLEIENPSQIRKKRFLARHPEPRLETSSKILVLKEGIPLVFFEQEFSSETLKSRGLKELEWTRTHSGWKIRGEKFYELPAHSAREPLANPEDLKARVNTEKTIKLSFVIHVSSHAVESSAVSLVNRLRKNGFDAYWVPVRISKAIQIYRVYVGRFSDWDQAQRVVRILRKKPFGGHATAIPYPFALQVGEANSLTEARMLLESLRKSGLSGLLLVSYNEPARIHFRIVVGAFKKADNATWILQQLKQSGFAGKLISP
ncbi:MAG: SPOR domain-containing protein [Nitrospinota bacterium]|nr:SPOR domain-containing protein [Nitrospinota bacterium]